MPKYMTQLVRSGTLAPITYYQDGGDHPTHKVSSAFTNKAKADYAKTRGIDISAVELGAYKSGQGVPSSGECKKI